VIPAGLVWNEAQLTPEQNQDLKSCLVSLLAKPPGGDLQLVGSAFIVEARGNRALAITAAHCLEMLSRIVQPNPLHHASTPREFLPSPRDLDLKAVRAMYLQGPKVSLCEVELAIWDEAADFAALTLKAPGGEADLFRAYLRLDDSVPAVGDVVTMIGIGDMQVFPGETTEAGKLQQRVVMRIGRVEGIHPAGRILLRSPCIETSISIYSGMSGGLVAKFATSGSIAPFAVISHAPEPQPILDRAASGHSVAVVVKMQRAPLADGGQVVAVPMSNVKLGRL